MTVRYDIGPPVEPRDVPVPTPVVLEGRTTRLDPVDPDSHAAPLLDELQGDGADPHMWDYLGYGPFAGEDDYRAFLRGIAASSDPAWFTIVSIETGLPVGLAALMRIDAPNRCVEIGHLNFGRSMQRSTMATETIWLLLRHAFDLGYRRVEWKCNDLNERSRRAALRFGFTYEGTFRKHLIVKGRSRDTAWYAMTDDDWPRVDAAFRRWLDPSNFDADGRQLTPLDTAAGG